MVGTTTFLQRKRFFGVLFLATAVALPPPTLFAAPPDGASIEALQLSMRERSKREPDRFSADYVTFDNAFEWVDVLEQTPDVTRHRLGQYFQEYQEYHEQLTSNLRWKKGTLNSLDFGARMVPLALPPARLPAAILTGAMRKIVSDHTRETIEVTRDELYSSLGRFTTKTLEKIYHLEDYDPESFESLSMPEKVRFVINQGGLLDPNFVEAFDPELRATINHLAIRHVEDVLRHGDSRLGERQEQMQEELRGLEDRDQTQATTLSKLETELDQERKNVAGLTYALTNLGSETDRQIGILATEQAAIHGEIDSISADISEVHRRLGESELTEREQEALSRQGLQDIQFIKNHLYSHMSAEEQLQALDQGWFDEENTKKLRAKAERIKQHEDIVNIANKVVDAASVVITLAEKFNVDPKILNTISTAVSWGSRAVSAFSKLSKGNVFGAIGALFGGGAGKRRHKEVMQGLGMLQEGQQRIMEGVGFLAKGQQAIVNNQQEILKGIVGIVGNQKVIVDNQGKILTGIEHLADGQQVIIANQDKLFQGIRGLQEGQKVIVENQGKILEGVVAIQGGQKVIVDNQRRIVVALQDLARGQNVIVDNQGRLVSGVNQLLEGQQIIVANQENLVDGVVAIIEGQEVLVENQALLLSAQEAALTNQENLAEMVAQFSDRTEEQFAAVLDGIAQVSGDVLFNRRMLRAELEEDTRRCPDVFESMSRRAPGGLAFTYASYSGGRLHDYEDIHEHYGFNGAALAQCLTGISVLLSGRGNVHELFVLRASEDDRDYFGAPPFTGARQGARQAYAVTLNLYITLLGQSNLWPQATSFLMFPASSYRFLEAKGEAIHHADHELWQVWQRHEHYPNPITRSELGELLNPEVVKQVAEWVLRLHLYYQLTDDPERSTDLYTPEELASRRQLNSRGRQHLERVLRLLNITIVQQSILNGDYLNAVVDMATVTESLTPRAALQTFAPDYDECATTDDPDSAILCALAYNPAFRQNYGNYHLFTNQDPLADEAGVVTQESLNRLYPTWGERLETVQDGTTTSFLVVSHRTGRIFRALNEPAAPQVRWQFAVMGPTPEGGEAEAVVMTPVPEAAIFGKPLYFNATDELLRLKAEVIAALEGYRAVDMMRQNGEIDQAFEVFLANSL